MEGRRWRISSSEAGTHRQGGSADRRRFGYPRHEIRYGLQRLLRRHRPPASATGYLGDQTGDRATASRHPELKPFVIPSEENRSLTNDLLRLTVPCDLHHIPL